MRSLNWGTTQGRATKAETAVELIVAISSQQILVSWNVVQTQMTSCFDGRKIDENDENKIVVCLKRLLVLLQLWKVMTVMKLIWIILWGSTKTGWLPSRQREFPYPLSFAPHFKSHSEFSGFSRLVGDVFSFPWRVNQKNTKERKFLSSGRLPAPRARLRFAMRRSCYACCKEWGLPKALIGCILKRKY